MARRLFQYTQRLCILLIEFLQLPAEQRALGSRAVDEKLAQVVIRKPEVLSQGRQRLVALDEMAVDLQVASRNRDLNAVSLKRAENEHRNHGDIPGAQTCALAPDEAHSYYMLSLPAKFPRIRHLLYRTDAASAL